MALSAASSQGGAKRMECKGYTFIARLYGPNKFTFTPQSNVFVMTRRGKQIIFRMGGQAPQLAAMAKNNLCETTL